jgi:hypothetical protein
MLISFTQLLLFQRSILMAFNPRNFISLIHSTQSYARPFDEIVYSYGSVTTDNDNLCNDPTSNKDPLT